MTDYNKYESIKEDGSIVVPLKMFQSDFSEAVKKCPQAFNGKEFAMEMKDIFINHLCGLWLLLTNTPKNNRKVGLYWDSKHDYLGMSEDILYEKFYGYFSLDFFYQFYECLDWASKGYLMKHTKKDVYFHIEPPPSDFKFTIITQNNERYDSIMYVYEVLSSYLIDDEPYGLIGDPDIDSEWAHVDFVLGEGAPWWEKQAVWWELYGKND